MYTYARYIDDEYFEANTDIQHIQYHLRRNKRWNMAQPGATVETGAAFLSHHRSLKTRLPRNFLPKTPWRLVCEYHNRPIICQSLRTR